MIERTADRFGLRSERLAGRHSFGGCWPFRPRREELLILDRLGRRQRAQEIAEIVSQRMKLETDSVGREGTAGQPRPFDRALAFLDPLFTGPALVIEGN